MTRISYKWSWLFYVGLGWFMSGPLDEDNQNTYWVKGLVILVTLSIWFFKHFKITKRNEEPSGMLNLVTLACIVEIILQRYL